MARKTYKDLLEEQVKLQERIEELRKKEALAIGEYVLKEFDSVDTLDDFKVWIESAKAKLAQARNVARNSTESARVQSVERPYNSSAV